MVQGETTILGVRLYRYTTQTQIHTFCSGLFRTVETTHSVGNNRTTNISSIANVKKIEVRNYHECTIRTDHQRRPKKELKPKIHECNAIENQDTNRALASWLFWTDLQLLPWHVRFFDGFGKSLLVSSQDTGKEIAVSAFQGRERQFVRSVVIVYSVYVWEPFR